MNKTILLKNSSTNEEKEIKVGFHWLIFLFGGLLFPWFKLGLKKEGIVFFMLMVGNIIAAFIWLDFAQTSQKIDGLFFIIYIVMGFQVAKIATKNYLKNGWVFSNPESEKVVRIKEKWKLQG